MRHIPIGIEKIKNYDCLDLVIYAICKWKNTDHQMMFCDGWNFDYDSNNASDLLSDKLILDRGSKIENIKKYHGLKMTQVFEKDLWTLITNEIDGNRPMLMKVDAYHCPWMFSHFKKVHGNHFVIVYGYDNENHILKCKDSQLAMDGVDVTYKDLMEAANEVYTIELLDTHSDINPKQVVEDLISSSCFDKGIHNLINEFGNDIKDKFVFEKEVKGFEAQPTIAPIFKQLTQLCQTRFKLSLLLEYLHKYDSNSYLLLAAEAAKKASEVWNEVFAMLVKAFYLRKREKTITRICNKIHEISQVEMSILQILKTYVTSDTEVDGLVESIASQDIEKSEIGMIQYIDIESHMNNNAIYHLVSSESEAELSNPNRFFVPDFEFPNDEVHVKQFKFKIKNFDNNGFDNISCKGQKVDVKAEYYNKIMFLSCSEFSDFRDDIIIEYTDGQRELIKTKTTTWISNGKSNDKLQSLSGKGVVNDQNGVFEYPFKVYIYASEYDINPLKKPVRSLYLPECENIHIFGISMGL